MRPGALLTSAAALLALHAALAVAQRSDAFSGSREHPAIQYNTASNDTAVTALNEKLEAGQAAFDFDPDSGYLKSVLDALRVPVESQAFVYTGTSLQAPKIKMANPRAVYFNDTVSVAYIRGAPLIEVWAQDPRQGSIFYAVEQKAEVKPHFSRRTDCLSCHLAWDTLAVPGPIVLTTFPRKTERDYANGFAVDDRVPLGERWGGWYVTGKAVPSHHMGNLPLFMDGAPPASSTPRETIEGLFDWKGYLTPYSDVVALMVLEHQSHALNLITRAGWESRIGNAVKMREAANDLADYLLFVDEAPIEGRIAGSSGFAERFSAEGPKDGQGRSLRQLRLEGRMMEYPLSYLVYSPPFAALPSDVKAITLDRIRDVLAGRDTSAKYAHLTPPLREAITGILKDTLPGF